MIVGSYFIDYLQHRERCSIKLYITVDIELVNFVFVKNVAKQRFIFFKFVDEAIKIANRNTASETVRTLLVYGYVLDPPSSDQQVGQQFTKIYFLTLWFQKARQFSSTFHNC